MKNPDRPKNQDLTNGHFFHSKDDGSKIFFYDYKPIQNYRSTIYIISGITGINHRAERDIIEQLSNNENRIVVVHPRGSGYSDGKRGDVTDFSLFIKDYVDLIQQDVGYKSTQYPVFLFGHSMSCAILAAIADQLPNIQGAILVNPAYLLKKAKGMSPTFWDYVKYAAYYIFAKHTPIVNMAGNPSLIQNEDDRKEAETRMNDPLLVKYFSLYMMMEAQKMMNSICDYAKKANYPLLLLHGTNDSIVDKKGCDLIFKNWKCSNKRYELITNGSHGKSTVKLANKVIKNWLESMMEDTKLEEQC